jgi:opacity protein-like surface antigen
MLTRTIFYGALCAAAAGAAAAQERVPRDRGSEFSIGVAYLDSKTTTFDGGTVVHTESAPGLGFNFDYRLGERWSVGGSMASHRIDYVADIAVNGFALGAPGDVVDGRLDTNSITGHGTRYFGDWKRVAPYVSAGLGWISVDTNVPQGPPVAFCRFDPWFGFICDAVQPTRTFSDMTATLGAGVRWDISRRLFLDAGFGRRWIDFDTAHRPDFSQFQLAVGFR